MIFNAMVEAVLFMYLLLGILIDLGKIVLSVIKTLLFGGVKIVSEVKRGGIK